MTNEIVDELVRDTVPREKAVAWADKFFDWHDGYQSNDVKLEPKKYAEYWTDEIFFPAGYGTTVFARQGMGKTNLAVYLIQTSLVLHPKWIFLHNIPFPQTVREILKDRLIEIRGAKQMMLEIIRVIRSEKVPVLCLDEFDSVFNSLNVNSKTGKSWQSFVWRQRHFSVRGPLMLYHASMSIPPAVRNKQIGGEILWIKPWNDERYISNPDLSQYMRIRKTKIPYLSHGSIGFEIDLDFSKILNQVSGSQGEIMDQIEERLLRDEPEDEKPEVTGQRKKEMKLTIIEKGKQLRTEGMSNRQIADELQSLFPDAPFVITPEWVKRNVS